MNKFETTLFVLFLALYFSALGLYHFMVFSVNERLPVAEKIPHSSFWGAWNRVKNEYNRLHPKSVVYHVTVTCAVAVLLIAMAFVALRSWEYAHGRLP